MGIKNEAKKARVIIHIDMDAFYASVEQLDNPSLKGEPVIVGGKPNQRGVVSAASYEAREYGVHSAMPLRQAYKLCPHAVFLPVNHERYEQISEEIMKTLKNYTPLVKPVSLDEAFMDVTHSQSLFGRAEEIAKKIKKQIKDKLGLTASVGIAPNMFLAKIASDLNKPDGFVVIKPGEEKRFLEKLLISKMRGVGHVTEKALKSLGIKTIGQLAAYPVEVLKSKFGSKYGEQLYKLAKGIDESEVTPESKPKSIGNEITYQEDTGSREQIRKTLFELAEQVGKRLRDENLSARTITLKLRFDDFMTITRSNTIVNSTDLGEDIFAIAWEMFEKFNLSRKLVRLVGVSTSNLVKDEPKQLFLFDEEDAIKKKTIARALDKIEDEIGEGVVRRGSIL